MEAVIDMTKANPYLAGGKEKEKQTASDAVDANAASPSTCSDAATRAANIASSDGKKKRKLEASENHAMIAQAPLKRPLVCSVPSLAPMAMHAIASMQQAANSKQGRSDQPSLVSNQTSSLLQDDHEDDNSCSSWSDSSFEDDDADDDFIMYAPTNGARRGQLLRPMSVDQITALAVATGARKPSVLQLQQQESSGKNQPRKHSGSNHTFLEKLQQVAKRQKLQNGQPNVFPHRSISMPDIGHQIQHFHLMNAGKTVVDPTTGKTVTEPPSQVKKPDQRLQEILEKEGRSVDFRHYHELKDFFLPVTSKHIEAFQSDIIQAVRGKDADAVKALHQKGKMLQCCNKFGESIMHMACRQSSPQVLHYLMKEAQVSIRVCCDSGRTPLHDACWTSEPNFDIIVLLIQECPDLLQIKDKRGFSPLSYVPHGQWQRWGDFLEEHKDLLIFREVTAARR